MSLHNALSLTVADGMPRLVTFFPDLMDQDYVFFVVEFLGGYFRISWFRTKEAR